MYVGDSSNSPVEQMSVKKYSQTSNPNLLDNTNFFNPINQRNQTSYSNTDAAPKYSIDRWQVLGGTFDVSTRTYTSNSTLGPYGNQFRQYIPLGDISIGDTITVSSVINNTKYVFTTTVPQYGDTVTNAPFLLETTWGGFKIITREEQHAVLLTMVVNVSQSITVDWIKIEFGNFATPYVPKEYSVELSECLRYFQRVYADWRIYPTLKDVPYRFSQSTLQVMRIKPTISAHGTPYTFGCTINALDARPMAFTVETKITEKGQTSGAASMLGHFDLSADL